MKTKRKSTPRTRLGAYLSAGVGLGTIAGSADAAIVNIDISNIGGPNGGVTSGEYGSISDFTSLGTTLYLHAGESGNHGITIYSGWNKLNESRNPGGIAVSTYAPYASPRKFVAGESIGPTSTDVVGFPPDNCYSLFKYTDYNNDNAYPYVTNETFSSTPASFLGFQNSAGDYGWLQVAWNGTDTFEILGGAFNDTPGEAIAAGALAGSDLTAVPEPASVLSTMGLLASGLLLRRRKLAA
jgi:hypothetical protein